MNNSPNLSVTEDVTVLDASGTVVSLDLSGVSIEESLKAAYAVLKNIKPYPKVSAPDEFFEEEKEREKAFSEMKSTLQPLSAETQAEVDAARTCTTEPEAANRVAYELTAEVDNTPLPEILRSNGWVSFQDNVSKGPWNVSAANDAAAGKDGFATYESTWLDQVVGETTPVVKERIDAYGRRYFSFENGIANSVVVIVFEVQGRRMLKIGDVILPLEEFFSLQSCDGKGEDDSRKGGEIRSGNEEWRSQLSGRVRFPTYVECVFPSRTVKIPNVNAVIIMSILTHLSKIFDFSAPSQPSAAVEPVVSIKNNESYSWWTGSLMGAFVSGIVYGAALVANRYK